MLNGLRGVFTKDSKGETKHITHNGKTIHDVVEASLCLLSCTLEAMDGGEQTNLSRRQEQRSSGKIAGGTLETPGPRSCIVVDEVHV